MKVLTTDQQLLARYLAELRMPRINRVLIVAELCDPDATMEMLQYIAETRETDHAKLCEVAREISKKYDDLTEKG